MRFFVSISFLFLFFCQNAQASDLETLDERQVINPYTFLFQTGEKFTYQGDDSVALHVKSSKPIITEVPVIQFGDTQNTPQYVKLLNKNSTVFDIVSGGKVVGKVITDIVPNNVGAVYVEKIEVDKVFQGQGIGTKTIELVIDVYQDRFKVKNFSAQIKTDNLASQRIFQKNDFSGNKSAAFGMYAYILNVS